MLSASLTFTPIFQRRQISMELSHVLMIRYSNSAVTMSGIKQTMSTMLLRAPSPLGITSSAAIVFSIFRKMPQHVNKGVDHRYKRDYGENTNGQQRIGSEQLRHGD
jgi:hypothetical protein